ncbi:MAG: ferritin-like domain-containing protein [Alphaproteobacteria bacterium]|nr:ferritin-like domain-containing protein [Alphaproteobacteria bacterium]
MPEKWKFEDIDWSLFDPEKVNPETIRVLKAGSVVEYNGSDYGLYLKGVFEGDTLFEKEIEAWSKDEIKHGRVLAQWVTLADPTYNFDERFKAYVEGFPIDIHAKESIRGSRGSELLTRCMVEIGTSSFYAAVRDATDEPLLKQICHKIAADELRHYKLFYTHYQRYQAHEKIPLRKRLQIALGRLFENEDDELAFAYYTANKASGPYNRKYYTQEYGKAVYTYYQKIHVERGMSLFCKVVGFHPQGWIQKGLSALAFKILSSKAKAYKRELRAA